MNRRTAVSAFAALAAGLCLPKLAFARAPDDVRAAMLEAVLAEYFFSKDFDQRFSVTRFETVAAPDNITLNAVVRLEWRPGTRQRQFIAHGTNINAAFDALLAVAIAEFVRALGPSPANT